MIGCLLWLWAAAVGADDGAGMVNGSFATAGPKPGLAEGWSLSSDTGVKMRPRREQTPDGRWAQVVECTEFQQSGPASHAMLCQVDTIRLEKGAWYRLRLRLRAESVLAGSVNVAISNMADWSNCGLSDGAMVDENWQDCEFWFQATQTVSTRNRLQLWWMSTGTVWFQDVRLERQAAPPGRHYGEEVAPLPSRNLLPNGGFEAGAAGWGSIADVPGWGGNLNRLYGTIDGNRPHGGRNSLAIALSPETAPTVWFDYYDPRQELVRNIFAANRGWITVKPGRRYTLSAWLRAAAAPNARPLTAVLRLRHSSGGRSDKPVEVRGEWARYTTTVAAPSDQLYVAIGLDLAASGVDRGTLWVDDVQFEEAAQATPFEPRSPVTVGLRAAADGGLFQPGEAVGVLATVANESAAERRVTLEWHATDAYDRPLGPWRREVAVPAGQAVDERLLVPATALGCYRVTVTAEGADISPPRPLRLAVIQPNQREDTVCGMNHGYPTADLLKLSRSFGLGWFRDWSLKWEEVEPEKGRFRFERADAQIDRVREHRLHVLGLLPFPSARWSSSKAGEADASTTDGVRVAVAAAPRDEAEFANYVRQTVAHLKGRITAFEIFNEPIYTGYSLPKRNGYSVPDYIRWLRVASQAAREANPQAFVIGGIQCPPNALMVEFIRGGGAQSVDAVSIHHYPGRTRPETMLAGLADMRQALAAVGRPDLPLYWTEGAYYADDDMPLRPFRSWLSPMPNERLCSAYTVRLNAILCANNTRRIIYHSGTPGEINSEGVDGIFFEYDGLPRKMVAALAAFNALVGPDYAVQPAPPTPEGTYAFVFRSGGQTVVITWALNKRSPLTVDRAVWRALDMFGRELPAGPVALRGDPVYLVAPGTAAKLPVW